MTGCDIKTVGDFLAAVETDLPIDIWADGVNHSLDVGTTKGVALFWIVPQGHGLGAPGYTWAHHVRNVLTPLPTDMSVAFALGDKLMGLKRSSELGGDLAFAAYPLDTKDDNS
jgi:hypothetical protein